MTEKKIKYLVCISYKSRQEQCIVINIQLPQQTSSVLFPVLAIKSEDKVLTDFAVFLTGCCTTIGSVE